MTSPSPEVAIRFQPNRYYKTEEEYEYAIAEVMKREYKAIVDAGFVLQLDCPLGAGSRPEYRAVKQFRKAWAQHIDIINYATKGLPPEQMRIHVCWGGGEGPHHLDPQLKDILDLCLKAYPAGISIVGANGRHEFEWKVWKDFRIPEGKVVIPGVIDSYANVIEHPETVAGRIARYAGVVGRQNVIGGVDCGLTVIAGMEQVDPRIAWAKLKSLSEGAALVTKELWARSARKPNRTTASKLKPTAPVAKKTVQSTRSAQVGGRRVSARR